MHLVNTLRERERLKGSDLGTGTSGRACGEVQWGHENTQVYGCEPLFWPITGRKSGMLHMWNGMTLRNLLSPLMSRDLLT